MRSTTAGRSPKRKVGALCLVLGLAILPGSPAAASWSAPVRVGVGALQRLVADGDRLHLSFWSCDAELRCSCAVRSSKNEGLSWGPTVACPAPPEGQFDSHWAVAGGGGRVHLVAVAEALKRGNDQLVYAWKGAGARKWRLRKLPGRDAHLEEPEMALGTTRLHMTFERIPLELSYRGLDLPSGAMQPPRRLARGARQHALAASGRTVHVVWSGPFRGNHALFYRRSDDEGRSWTPRRRLVEDVDVAWFPSLTAVGADVHLAWTIWGIGERREEVGYRSSRDGGRSWGPRRLIATAPRPTFANTTALAAAGRDVHLTWFEQVGTPQGGTARKVMYARSGDRGRSWQRPRRLGRGGEPIGPAALAVTGGAVHVVMESRFDLLYRRRETGPQ